MGREIGIAVTDLSPTSKTAKAEMARWPDNSRSTLITALLIFGLFPLLALLAWWFVYR